MIPPSEGPRPADAGSLPALPPAPQKEPALESPPPPPEPPAEASRAPKTAPPSTPVKPPLAPDRLLAFWRKIKEGFESRKASPVYVAATVGAVIGTAGVLSVFLLLRQTQPPPALPPGNPFPPAPVQPAVIAPPAPAPAPPPKDEERQTAFFDSAPRVKFMESTAPANAVPPAHVPPETPEVAMTPKETSVSAATRARRPKAAVAVATWSFEGTVFDLLTAEGVFAAKLSFKDGDGNAAGETATKENGRYKISLPGGDSRGYTLKISHPDYTDRYIDEGDATSSLRDATPEERRMLMQAAARSLPWIGSAKTSIRRDLGLVPKSAGAP